MCLLGGLKHESSTSSCPSFLQICLNEFFYDQLALYALYDVAISNQLGPQGKPPRDLKRIVTNNPKVALCYKVKPSKHLPLDPTYPLGALLRHNCTTRKAAKPKSKKQSRQGRRPRGKIPMISPP